MAFTENFLKGAHLSKEHVPERSPYLAFVTMVFSPEIIIDELINLHPKLLQGQLGGNRLLCVCRRIAAQLNGAHFAATYVVAKAVTEETIVILHFRLKQHLLQWRDLLIATREDEPDFRRQVALHHEFKLRRILVLPLGCVHKLQFIHPGLAQDMPGQKRNRFFWVNLQLDD